MPVESLITRPAQSAPGAPPLSQTAQTAQAAGEAPDASAPSGAGSVGHPSAPLDDTAETVPDAAETLAQTFAKRAAILVLAQQSEQQQMQARLDRMKADFNSTQEERTEQLREMNALRDMALAQAKVDDEVLKKYIAMIA